MVYLDKECPEKISGILYNQIGILTLCSEEIENLILKANNWNKESIWLFIVFIIKYRCIFPFNELSCFSSYASLEYLITNYTMI